MNLSFKTQINNVPTYFVEKILTGMGDREIDNNIRRYFCSKYYTEDKLMNVPPKIHSIRADEKNRWKAGNKIHFVINNRTKNRLQFAPVLEVVSTQHIVIKYYRDSIKTEANVSIDGKDMGRALWLNCRLADASLKIEQLAKADGFDNVNEFFDWFSVGFTGKIIHWTDFKY